MLPDLTPKSNLEKEAFPIARSQSTKSVFSDRWRVAFLALALLVLIALLALWGAWVSLTHPAPRVPVTPPASAESVPVEASVSLDAINRYVAMQVTKKETPVQKATFALEKQMLRADASLYFFGRAANLAIWMKPEIQPNGDLRLVAQDVEMGHFSLPLKTLFAVLEGMPWPPWVHVLSEQYTIDLKFSEQTSQDFRYQIKKIDWAQERIQLEIDLMK